MTMNRATDPRVRLIIERLERFGLSERWLASKLNVNHASVNTWLNGTTTPRNKNVFSSALDLLSEYEKQISGKPEGKIKRIGIVTIPVYPGISAGLPVTTISDVSEISIKDWGNTRQRWGRIVDGLSMSDRIEPGDIVIFEDRPAQPYNIVHAANEDGDTVKVLRGYGQNATLAPINKEFPTISAAGFEIKGVAVGIVRRLADGGTMTLDYPNGMNHRE